MHEQQTTETAAKMQVKDTDERKVIQLIHALHRAVFFWFVFGF